jgi:type 1 glutamine amidotransferase
VVRAPIIYVTQVAPYNDGPAGVHGVLGQSVTALAQLADAAGLSFRHVRDVRDLTSDEVTRARVVALFTIGETPWGSSQRAALLDGVRSGRSGLMAVHAATDSCYGWDAYGTLVGARFNGHPWTQDLTLDVCDQGHPAVSHLGPTWAWYDEVYQFRDLRPDARVLLRINEAQLDLARPGVVRPPFGFPLSWCFEEGLGRVFSTSLGHFPAAWESTAFLRHLDGGLSWLLDRHEPGSLGQIA